MEIKTCGRCKQEYPATLEYFHRNGKYGFYSICKKCKSAFNKQNKEIVVKRIRQWEKENPQRLRESRRRRHYRRKVSKLVNGSEPYTEQQILDKYGHNCYLCQEPIDFTVPRKEPKGFQVEHVIAISKGGPDTLENVRPSHAYCNWSKGNKALEDLSKS